MLITIKIKDKPEETFDISGMQLSGDYLVLDVQGQEAISGKQYFDFKAFPIRDVELFRRYVDNKPQPSGFPL